MDNFGLPELVAALRARIESDTDLLAKVAQFSVEGDAKQSLDALSELVAIEDCEAATKGKLKIGQLLLICTQN